MMIDSGEMLLKGHHFNTRMEGLGKTRNLILYIWSLEGLRTDYIPNVDQVRYRWMSFGLGVRIFSVINIMYEMRL